MAFKLTPYGRRELAIVLGLCLALVVILAWTVWPLVAIPAAVAIWTIVFFRDPDRQPPKGPGLILSPADGHVADITPVGAESMLGADGVKIGIFMNVINVHVNRCPEACVVQAVQHKPGRFYDVRRPMAAEANESATITVRCGQGEAGWVMLIRQVAGLVARRIVTDVQPGDTLQRGQRIGMIKFGSRLEVWVPSPAVGRIRVDVGQMVRAGQSVLIETPEARLQ